MAKINPFRPNSVAPPGMFAGRWSEVKRLEAGLEQTAVGYSTHFMLTGERGIGKSSLLSFIRWVATGEIDLDDDRQFNFLVIDIDIDSKTTQFGLVKKIELQLKRVLGKSEKARSYLNTAWSFVQRVEALGVKINDVGGAEAETMIDEFAFSLSDTIGRLCQSDEQETVFSARYEGILLLVDEADNAGNQLDLGVFLKQLLERLHRQNSEKMMVVLSGLPEIEAIIRDSHPSALRLFEDLRLNRLTDEEVNSVIDRCLVVAKEKNGQATEVTDSARTLLISLSEGFPHFIQQFGFSAFSVDKDDSIGSEDVLDGAFGNDSYPGALKLIGDRYYRNDFYNKIQKESYRQVLRIMANEEDQWVSKKTIKAKFKGKDSILDNAIKALRSRHIILSKEGVRGVYGLQHRGFALWIKLYATEREKIAIEMPEGYSAGD